MPRTLFSSLSIISDRMDELFSPFLSKSTFDCSVATRRDSICCTFDSNDCYMLATRWAYFSFSWPRRTISLNSTEFFSLALLLFDWSSESPCCYKFFMKVIISRLPSSATRSFSRISFLVCSLRFTCSSRFLIFPNISCWANRVCSYSNFIWFSSFEILCMSPSRTLYCWSFILDCPSSMP